MREYQGQGRRGKQDKGEEGMKGNAGSEIAFLGPAHVHAVLGCDGCHFALVGLGNALGHGCSVVDL